MMTMKTRMCAALAALMLAACAQSPEPATQTPVEVQTPPQGFDEDMARLAAELRAPGVFVAGIGETADLGGGLTIRPIEVIEDSRCPANVDCVWAGRLRLRAVVAGEEIIIVAGEPVATARGGFVLAVVSPGRWHPMPQTPPPYRFGFRRA